VPGWTVVGDDGNEALGDVYEVQVAGGPHATPDGGRVADGPVVVPPLAMVEDLTQQE
jgi:hypothetical protein